MLSLGGCGLDIPTMRREKEILSICPLHDKEFADNLLRRWIGNVDIYELELLFSCDLSFFAIIIFKRHFCFSMATAFF
jgi:hypothetical protein